MFSRHREAAICLGRGWEGQRWKYQTDIVGQRWNYENRDDVFASVGIAKKLACCMFSRLRLWEREYVGKRVFENESTTWLLR